MANGPAGEGVWRSPGGFISLSVKNRISKAQLFSDPSIKPTTRLWLVRHAEVEAKYQGTFGGRIDMDLSPKGHLQAASLGRYLAGVSFDACYASPMRRVRQTMESMQLAGLPEPVVLEGLREIDFGSWTGLAFHEVQERFGVDASTWLEQIETGGMAGGESTAVFGARVKPCLDRILTEQPGKNILVPCHGGVIRMLLAITMGLPLPKMSSFQVEYASITQIWWPAAEPELRLVNFTPWRDIGI